MATSAMRLSKATSAMRSGLLMQCRGMSRSAPPLLPKVVVVNGGKYDLHCTWDAIKPIAEFHRYHDSTPEQIIERCEDADIVVTKELPVGADLIEKLPSTVKAICEAGTGYNNIDVKAAKNKGLVVCNVPAYSNEAVATLAMTYLLNFSASLFEQQKRLWQGNYDSFTDGMIGGGGTVMYDLPHTEVTGKVLGVIGGGRIGQSMMDLALPFGLKVLVYDPYPGKRTDVEWTSLEDLLARSDYVSIHCPLFPSTHHLMNSERLKMMKKTAFLINCARGPVVKEEDVIKELHAGTIAGCALDVQEVEPVDPHSPLFTTPGLVLSPHIGWQRLESRQKLVDTTIENCDNIFKGTPSNVVS
mmetsp:Transcript_59641/g.141919  ORF Transcript_59641/g.141919 Transcript_59641/m.141919 type:complete len:357 (-) Transcript_59641:88-1158(-)|eukprot:CAMPEP_0178420672 /NCGR_PEP_ID=MMETSP0689_2-20121128/26253_1 /TAXON_ID=160604 /ORGANISM="Amphidinium massartii, Strain CS-259" /LENGTH=356 /DNA_ID=CAMNT_0020042161 /DNA_START=72 /DNA_END=1142 /DNA_ORIENTATION=+